MKKNNLLPLLHRVWGVVSHNIGLKLLSIVFAILIWSMVVSSDTSITRTKTISKIDTISVNQTLLTNNSLALTTDPTALLDDLMVKVEVPQASYALVSRSSVQVSLDLTGVRSPGTQEVPLTATCSYGSVVDIYPDSIELTVEPLDSRSVPINVMLAGDRKDDLWYSIVRMNPNELTISGASSIVQDISSAYVSIDVSERAGSFVTAARYQLLDSENNEIPQDMVRRSSTSVTVGVDVYPTKELPLISDINSVVKGQPAAGYRVTDVTIQPETVTVAASEELLDGLKGLVIESVSVDGRSRTFSQRAQISSLSSFQHVSANQVYVTVTIEEENSTAVLDNLHLAFVDKSDDLTVTWHRDSFTARVSGPKSAVDRLRQEGINAFVDLSGLTAGEHSLPIQADPELYPEITFEFEPATVRLTLTEADMID